jgi:hypothetical protein
LCFFALSKITIISKTVTRLKSVVGVLYNNFPSGGKGESYFVILSCGLVGVNCKCVYSCGTGYTNSSIADFHIINPFLLSE